MQVEMPWSTYSSNPAMSRQARRRGLLSSSEGIMYEDQRDFEGIHIQASFTSDIPEAQA